MEPSCLFCRIIQREVPAKIVWENDDNLAFWDINPKAPVHILVIPKKHMASLSDATPEDTLILGNLLQAVRAVAASCGIEKDGFRTIINTRHHSGQVVDHLHLHVLGGEPLGPMPAS